MALTCVLGSEPNSILSPQNNLLLVANCACTSKPITASYLSKGIFINCCKNRVAYRYISFIFWNGQHCFYLCFYIATFWPQRRLAEIKKNSSATLLMN